MKKLTLTVTEFRKNLFKMLEKVDKEGVTISLTIHGKPQWTIISWEEYDSLLETIDVLSDSSIVKDIEKARKEFKAGKTMTLAEFRRKLNSAKNDLPN